MTSCVHPNQTEFSSYEDNDVDECCAQLPNSTVYKSLGNVSKNSPCNQECTLIEDNSLSCLEIKKSIEFRKPSNENQNIFIRSLSDFDTQCDSSDSESDDECCEMDEEELKIAEENYNMVVDRCYALVRGAKESKFRGIISIMLLREKLYQIVMNKRMNSNSDDLFREYDFSSKDAFKENTKSFPIHTIKKGSALADQNKRTKQRNEKSEDLITSFFSFLIRPTTS